MRPCSSPAKAMNTSVASKSIRLCANTRASSIVSTVPLPSSLAPGAGLSAASPAGAGRRARGPPGVRRAGERVVVAADVDQAAGLAGQHGHDVAQVHVVRDPPLRRHLVGVEAHLQARARPLHLLENPLARGPDALGGRVLPRQRVARAEALELLVERLQPRLGDLGQQLLDSGVELGGLRARGRRGAQRGRERDDEQGPVPHGDHPRRRAAARRARAASAADGRVSGPGRARDSRRRE